VNSIAYLNKNENSISGDRIKVYPDILLSAARGANGGAAKLWTLAKHFDQPGGYGLISNNDLRSWVINDLSWKPGTYDRYINQAGKLGIIERRGDKLRLAAAEHAALAVGCKHLGDIETIPLKGFLGKHWQAFIYGAFMRRFNGHTLAAKTISELTGIAIRTIYHYDKLLGRGIKKRRNYAILDLGLPADNKTISGLNEQGGWHVFSGFNKLKGQLIKSMPGQRFIYAEVASKPKHLDYKGKLVNTKNGQRKRINSAINAMLLDSSQSEGNTIERVKERLYIEQASAKARKDTERMLRTHDNKKPGGGPGRYKFLFEQYGAGFYAAI